MSNDNSGPAFPSVSQEYGPVLGLSIRDYFAAKAIQGFMANKERPYHFKSEDDADYCYQLADAMLKAREK